MPKRPCAIALTPDDSTILCADKFGDVYSMPLMGQTYDVTNNDHGLGPDEAKQEVEGTSEAFIPSASSLTVHTKRNKDALQQQQNLKKDTPEKAFLKFDHHLLLGHVSLLTDVACASLESSEHVRTYIFTSDRDEHIRVSRGIPQAHIIEGYCLGHTHFVSKMCIPSLYPGLMISGGGDGYLLLWDWLSGSIKQKVELKSHVESFKEQQDSASTHHRSVENGAIKEDWGNRLAVSKIQCMETHLKTPLYNIIVTVEG